MTQNLKTPKPAVLLIQLGTPSQPTYFGLWRYLSEFLSDRRVVHLPRLLWLGILYGIILPLRSGVSAAKYREIWTKAGSPLAVHSLRQCQALQQAHPNIKFALGFRYGSPSIKQALDKLLAAGARDVTVLPLYPQYAESTTASAFDAVAAALKHVPFVPGLRFIQHYADHPAYIDALVQSIQSHWQQHGRGEKLLISYHGIPQARFEAGDPYYCYCHKTTRLLAEKLKLADTEYQMVFQSRFGRAKWLEPYCLPALEGLAKSGMKTVDVICPGFAADCLETLHEICIECQADFQRAGGEKINYIPALNSSEQGVQALAGVLSDARVDCITYT